jgi:hypothetical protein
MPYMFSELHLRKRERKRKRQRDLRISCKIMLPQEPINNIIGWDSFLAQMLACIRFTGKIL